MKIISLKLKLLIPLLIGIFFTFLISGTYNATNEYNTEYDLVKHDQLQISQESSKFINEYLKSKLQVVSSVANMIENSNLTIENKNLVNRLMAGKQAGSFASMYLGLQNNGDLIKFDGSFKSIATMNYDARVRPWYKKFLKTRTKGVTKPFVDSNTKRLIITLFAPVYDNKILVGVVGANIFLDTVIDEILNIKLGNGGFAYLVSNNGEILIHKNKELLTKNSKSFNSVKTKDDIKFSEIDENGVKKLISYSKIPLSSWYLVLEVEKDTIFKQIIDNVIIDVLVYIVILLFILGFVYFLLKKLLSPLSELESGLYNFFEYIKGNRDSANLLNINSNDEFGNMALKINEEIKSVELEIEKDRLLIEDVKNVVEKIKGGDLDVQVEQTSLNPSLNDLKDMINEMIIVITSNVHNNINVILSTLDDYAKSDFKKDIEDPKGKVSKGLNSLCDIINEMLRENYKLGITLENNAKQLLENVDILNKSSNQTAASLEETSASIEEITSTIAETTDNISKMAAYSNTLLKSINEGQNLAKMTVDSMNEINEQTTSIAEAITVIDQIAFQTNILSLNAAVEAATAGEAGKGFAVVAQEVRNLAARSAEAAKEIKDLVENATLKANVGKKNADEMIEGYIKLNENINKTTELILHVENAAKEQTQGIEQINDAVANLDRRTQENANVAMHTQEVAIDTSNIAKNILENVNKKEFRKE